MAHGRTSQAVGVNGQLVEYRYDGTVKTVSNWPADSGFTQYELGSVRDITRLRGRYAWSKDGTDSWFITDLEDESHPDRYSAQYRAESQPDGIIGISCQLAQRQKLLERQQSSQETSVPQET